MVARLKTCCGCGTLQTGTIIVGALHILSCVIGIVMFLVGKDQNQQQSKAVQIIAILLYVTVIILSVLMIIGAVKKNWILIVPWLVVDGILIGLHVIIFILICAGLFTYGFVGMGIVYLIVGILATLLSIYLWYVPFSYHFELKDEIQRGTYSQGPRVGA